MAEPLVALETEVDGIGRLLEGLSEADWHRPTRCPPLDLREVTAHMLGGAVRLVEMGSAAAIDDEPEQDAVTYFQYDPASVADDIVERARARASGKTGHEVLSLWKEHWGSALEVARERWEQNPVFRPFLGTIRLREYVRTRCVEVTVHHMDLRDALGQEPDPTPAALEATCEVLRGLLGADLRPMGMDDLRFALVGTGRETLTDPEREILGPLAEEFPLLA